MYAAKDDGKGRVRYFEPAMLDAALADPRAKGGRH
jgi:hypothetical protein